MNPCNDKTEKDVLNRNIYNAKNNLSVNSSAINPVIKYIKPKSKIKKGTINVLYTLNCFIALVENNE